MCVHAALSDRKVGRWGLHSKKGFLSRWQLQDWQDAILLGSSVSQPVSLRTRQPLTPLNLAFCWVVTGLAVTPQCGRTDKPHKEIHRRWEVSSMNSLYKLLQLEAPLMASKLPCLLFLFYLAIFVPQTHTHTRIWTIYSDSIFSMAEHRLCYCAGMEMPIFVHVCVPGREVCCISSTLSHTL